MHGSRYPSVRHKESVEDKGHWLCVHSLQVQVYLAYLAVTSQIPNVFRTFDAFEVMMNSQCQIKQKVEAINPVNFPEIYS